MGLSAQLEKQGNWLFKHRSNLPLIIFTIGTLVYINTEIHPESFFLEETPYETYYEMFAFAISLLGFVIRIYTVGYTPKNTSGRNTAEQLADTLNTKGIYSIVRNPLYLGNFFMWIGPAILTGNIWFICFSILSIAFFYERVIFAEEQFLKKKFGNTYLEWAKQTPCIIPRFGRFQKTDLKFNWHKVLRQEKNGLAALFIIFSFYDILGEVLEHSNSYNYFLLYGSVISLLLYFILKYLKYNSSLLKD